MSRTDKTLDHQHTSEAALLFDAGSKQPGFSGENWRDCFPEIIGRSPAISDILMTVAKIARSDSAVLVFGESGTGKELIASALHRLSTRSEKRFVPINCSAIPENLLESELFGHEKGAFTGATSRRAGHFEVANGGTIFLDEIGDMPLRLQAKLLRVLQEKQFTAVGGSHLKQADVRIVAATNIDLEKAIRNGQFRLDLFYRLNVLPVTLPPLRERRPDIVSLLDHFLNIANRIHNLSEPCYLSDPAMELLCSYEWPGNIRELQNLVERLVILKNGGEILAEHLPNEVRLSRSINDSDYTSTRTNTSMPLAPIAQTLQNNEGTQQPRERFTLPRDGINLTQYVESLENQMIIEALERTHHNKNQAAKLLGLNRTTLVERIKKRKIISPNPAQKT